MTIEQYLNNISREYQRGIATEHTYRGDLKQLIESIVPDVAATNEPKRIKCGAPDYVLTRRDIPIGFIEAKDIGDRDLDGAKKTGNKEQFDRYKSSLNNLIFTDYLDFHLYIDGAFVASVKLAEIVGGKISGLPDNFDRFANLIKDFANRVSQTITSSRKLAEMMAGKARILSDVIEKSLLSDEANDDDSTLKDQMNAFKAILIHDITPKEFADVYAQTIAYGMFAARLHDASLETFTRQEAAELIPKSNPFLRKLFGYIAGPDIDDRIKWIVDSLANIFRATNVDKLLKDFGKSTQTSDPIIHFYETFLSEYDPKLRKSRGVWYTPEPIVKFIVRAVDDVLKTEFNLPNGLADTSKTRIKIDSQGKKVEKEVHKVQILDPATGTGTFLAEVIRHVYQKFANQQGVWSNYVENHLIPRLNGFELLMASYAMAHLKLDLLLGETNYKPTKSRRLQIYLTNSLEEHHPDTGTLFAGWLSAEANEANHIKRDTPVMCVIGNPPYSGISQNNGSWISNLIDDYKYVDGEHFNERKHWLNDDYVKFLRFGEHFVEKNGEGVLAFINNHSFIDNPTFRGMRWHLLNTFDTIYIIDLHGNSLKKEVSPDGSTDKNVFDIQAGVSINIFVKTGRKKKGALAKVKHFELWGDRESKYRALQENDLKSCDFKDVEYTEPYYFFKPKNETGKGEYENGFRIDELMPVNVTGIVTARDSVVIDIDKESLLKRINRFCDESYSDSETRQFLFPNKKDDKYPAGDSRSWKLSVARKKIKNNKHADFIKTISYRPFDDRNIYYTPDMVDWGRESLMRHFQNGENIGLMTCRQSAINSWEHIGITKLIADDSRVSNRSRERGYIYPLYLYPETKQNEMFASVERTPNLNAEIVGRIADKLQLTFTNEKEIDDGTFAPIDVLDYIYAVLHSPSYREKYKEFLKIDFPRVPFPKDEEIFWQLVSLGKNLRELHLLEAAKIEEYTTQYPVDGDNLVGKIRFEDGRVWINDSQYFDNVSPIAWNFYIGGYQPAQKWLKDRKDRTLDYEDIFHYQKIIVALTETDWLMREIDRIEIV